MAILPLILHSSMHVHMKTEGPKYGGLHQRDRACTCGHSWHLNPGLCSSKVLSLSTVPHYLLLCKCPRLSKNHVKLLVNDFTNHRIRKINYASGNSKLPTRPLFSNVLD